MDDYFKTQIKEYITDELDRGYEMGEIAARISKAMNEAEAEHKKYQEEQLRLERLDIVHCMISDCIRLMETYADELPSDVIQEIERINITNDELEKSLRVIENAIKSYGKMSAGLADFAAKLEAPVKKTINLDIAANLEPEKKDINPDAILRKWVNSLT